MHSPKFLERNYFLMIGFLAVSGAAVILVGTVLGVADLQLLQDRGFEWRRLIGVPVLLLGVAIFVIAIMLGRSKSPWIDASEMRDVEDWAKKLKVPVQRILAAIEVVGTRASHVRRYLDGAK